jgi:predicted nucleotidyltransferase
MDRTEKILKLSLTLFPAILMFFLFNYYYPMTFSIVISFIIAHTLNWIFNGHLFGLVRNFGIVYNEPQIIIDYANEIKIRVSKEKSIDCVAVYGSLSRDEIKPTSDLDVRIIRKPGITNGLRACMFGLIERSRALFDKFPIDLFVVDSTEHLKKMRDDEKPQILYDPNGTLKKQILE